MSFFFNSVIFFSKASVILMLGVKISFSQTLAFPGAEGFGAYSNGGRGGDVYSVTNLNDSGVGSLRYGLKHANGPRTIVFSISGIIDLKSQLRVDKSYITVAGQTAPGDGICIKGANFSIEANHVILRYLRFRLGSIGKAQDDAVSIRDGKNIIIDHCSASWSVDETLSCQSSTADLITVQWSIISESLNNSTHKKGTHGFGGIIGSARQSFHHNLYAHHTSRTPKVTGRRHCKVDFRNNVIYNWVYNNCYDGTSSYMNWVNNYYKYGPATKPDVKYQIFQLSDAQIKSENVNSPEDSINYETTLYLSGNYITGSPSVSENNWLGVRFKNGANIDDHSGKTPFKGTPLIKSETSAIDAYKAVLDYAGASKPRDLIDKRIVNEVFTGSASNGDLGIIDNVQQVGGWPVYKTKNQKTDSDYDGMPDRWEITNYLNPKNPDDRNGDDDNDGYTNLEEYLNYIAF